MTLADTGISLYLVTSWSRVIIGRTHFEQAVAEPRLTSMDPDTVRTLALKWVMFNIALALIPLFINAVVLKLAEDTQPGTIPTGSKLWISLLKDGELFIFTTTVLATSVGNALLDGQTLFTHLARSAKGSSPQVGSNSGMLLVIGLTLFVFIGSTTLFGILAWSKVRQQNPPSSKLIAAGSIGFAILASFLGFILHPK